MTRVEPVANIIEVDPFERNGTFDLTQAIHKTKEILLKVEEILEGPLPVVDSETLWEIIKLLEDKEADSRKRQKLATKLREISRTAATHQGWLISWNVIITNLVKLVKVGGDQRIAKEDRVTKAQMNKLFHIITQALNRHVRDAKVLQAVTMEIESGMAGTNTQLARENSPQIEII